MRVQDLPALLLVLLVILAGCSGGGAAATYSTVDLTEGEEAWWCESLAEAREWGLTPEMYADYAEMALGQEFHNAPVRTVAEAAAHLRSVSCDVEYAREAADHLG